MGTPLTSLATTQPSSQRVLTRVPEATPAVLKAAVDRAEAAFDEWKDSSVLKRQAVMLKYVSLARDTLSSVHSSTPCNRESAPLLARRPTRQLPKS